MITVIKLILKLIVFLFKIEKSKNNNSKLEIFLNSSFVNFFTYEGLGFSKKFHMCVDIFELLFYFFFITLILDFHIFALSFIVRMLIILTYRLIKYFIDLSIK